MALIGQINTTTAHWQSAAEGQQHAIARDSNGILWAAYGDEDLPDGTVLAAYSLDGGVTWTEETAIAFNSRCYPWAGISIVISSDNVPHIIYAYDPVAGNSEIRYVNRAGGVWGAPETVVDHGVALSASNQKAAIDSTDTIHIIYQRGTIRYIFGTSGAWSLFEVADAAGTRPDMTINIADQPVIVFVSAVPVGIHVRYRAGGVWQPVDTVDPTDGINPRPQIEVDSVGDYHVAWMNEELFPPWNYEVYYRKKQGGGWLARQELDSDVIRWDVGVGLDDEDNAYVFYQYRGADEEVYYRKVTNGTVLGVKTAITAGFLRPNTESSVFTFLYHKYPANGVLAAALQPVVALLDEVGADADVFFFASGPVLPFSLPIVQTDPATEVG